MDLQDLRIVSGCGWSGVVDLRNHALGDGSLHKKMEVGSHNEGPLQYYYYFEVLIVTLYNVLL